MARAKLQVTGLKEFRAQLKTVDKGMPRMIRVALNEASTLVVNYAKPKVPTGPSGAARASLKVRSSQTQARIAAGGNRAPYYPWLDFGGHVGQHGATSRPFYTEGRYIYPGLKANREEIIDAMAKALTALAVQAGLEVN